MPRLWKIGTWERLTWFTRTARLLRSLGSVGAIGEVGEVGAEAYVPTKTSHTFTIPPLAAGVEFW